MKVELELVEAAAAVGGGRDRAGLACARQLCLDHHLDPVARQRRRDERRRILVLARQQLGPARDDGDSGAKHGKRLSHLEADGPAAEHDDPGREAGQVEQRLVGHVG